MPLKQYTFSTLVWTALFWITWGNLLSQGSEQFDYAIPFDQETESLEYQWPLPSWEEGLPPGYDVAQVARLEQEVRQSLGALQDQVDRLQEMIEELEQENRSLAQERATWLTQIERLVAENELLLSQDQGFDPLQEEVIAANRAHLQELEQARRRAAAQIQNNQNQLLRYWEMTAEQEQSILRHEQLLHTCQLITAVRP